MIDQNKIPGLVNINTASVTVLAALLEGDEKTARDIISHRSTLSGPMESIAELLKIKTLSVEDFKKIANYITTRSGTFTVYCFARSDMTDAVYRAEAVVDRNQSPAQILYWHQGAHQ